MELALKYRGDAFRVVHALQIDDVIWVLHALQKKLTLFINA
jgi:phage-related protein